MSYARITGRAKRTHEQRTINAMIAATGLPLSMLVPTETYTLDAPGRKWHGAKLPGAALIAWHRKYHHT